MTRRWKSLTAAYLLSVLVMYASVCWNTRGLIAAGLPDFAIYYCAGAVVRQGLGYQLYDPAIRFEVQGQFASAVPLFRGPLPWTHPPYEALFYLPFSGFSYLNGYLLWNAFSLLLVGGTLWLLSPCLEQVKNRGPALWLLAFAFFPIFFNLLEGQDGIVLLFLYALVYRSLRNHRDALAGAFLAIGLFKFHLVLPFVFLLLMQRRWKIIYGFMPVSIAAVIVSLAISGTKSLWAYPRYLFYWESLLASGTDRVPANMPNLRGLMYLIFAQWRFSPWLVLTLSLILLLLVGWLVRQRPEKHFDLGFSLMLLATVLVSYHVTCYDLSILLIPVLLSLNRLLSANQGRRGWMLLASLSVGLMFCAPLQLLLLLHYKGFALMGVVLLLWAYALVDDRLLRGQNGYGWLFSKAPHQ